MTIVEHLIELRKRVIYSLWGILAGFLVCYHFSREIYSWLMQPLCNIFENSNCPVVYTSVIEPFMVYLKVGLVCGVFAASPWIFYQLWLFISPGLRGNEKKFLLPFVFSASVMFIGGALLGYFFIFPFAFKFFSKEATEAIRPMLSMQNYYSFATGLLLAFGFLFEIPVLVVLLNLTGLVQAKTLWRTWRYGVAGIFILAAVITPADPYTMLLFGIPLAVLYLTSLCICSLIERSKLRQAPSEA